MIEQLLLENWVTLVFGLISIAIVAYCKFLHKKFKEYQVVIEGNKKEEIESIVDARIATLKAGLEQHTEFFEVIKHSYKFRLMSLCDKYFERGYMTPKEYSQLNEMWGVYHGLLGNGQGDDYYHRAAKLPIREHHE